MKYYTCAFEFYELGELDVWLNGFKAPGVPNAVSGEAQIVGYAVLGDKLVVTVQVWPSFSDLAK